MLHKFGRSALMLLIFCSLGIASLAFAKEDTTGKITGSEVNMRSAPNQEADVVLKMSVGEKVNILGESDGWYQVEYSGSQGYIRSDLVFVKTTLDRIAYANKDGVNLRGGPSEGCYIETEITAGKPIRIKQMVGEWYFVSYEGRTGFVHKNMVNVTNLTGVGGDATLLKMGMEGSEVKKLQKELARRNFVKDSNVTGTYGAITRAAVKEFQQMAEISPADGIAGPATLKVIYDKSNTIRKKAKIPVTKDDFKGRVQLIDWWKGGSTLLSRNWGAARVTDVKTGKSFNIYRTGGTKHMDVVPRTADDTAIFKSIVGRWTWNRRAIWVTIGTKVYAASMNCMPHSPDSNKNDNFPGHFCIHFLNSRTHGGNNCDPDHQACVKYAYNAGK